MRKIILLWFILVPFFIFGQAISYTPKKTNTINKPFGIQVTKNTQIFVEDSNALYKITANYNPTDSMTTVFRDHNFIKLYSFSVTTANDTTGLDPTCQGLIIYSLSDNTIWQHSFVIDSITGDTTCIWVDISTAKWKTNGLDLYYIGGNVGVGVIPNDQAKLEVRGTVDVGIKSTTTIGNTYEGNSTSGIVFKGRSVNGVTVSAEATGYGNSGSFSANHGIGLYSTSIYSYAAWFAGRVKVTDTLWSNGKVFIPHITPAATSDSVIGRSPSGEMVLFPRSSGSGVIADSVPFVYNEARNTIYPRAYSTARVTIGDNVTTADINRKLHVEGSQYIKDTLFFGTYGDAIWTEPGPFSFYMNNDLHIIGGLYAHYLHLSGLNNDAVPDSLLTIIDGDVYKSSTAILKDSIYRYSAYSSGYYNVEVLATNLGITATRSGGDITFTIPAHIRLISAKIRVETLSSVVCYLGTSDMANSSMANRWMPIVQAWREDTGVQLMGMTTSMSLTDFTKFTINGLIPTTICQIRLIF